MEQEELESRKIDEEKETDIQELDEIKSPCRKRRHSVIHSRHSNICETHHDKKIAKAWNTYKETCAYHPITKDQDGSKNWNCLASGLMTS